jgi:phage FluMu protein Com
MPKAEKLNPEILTDFRCPRCRALLFKASEGNGTIEVKCRKCGYTVSMRLKESQQA